MKVAPQATATSTAKRATKAPKTPNVIPAKAGIHPETTTEDHGPHTAERGKDPDAATIVVPAKAGTPLKARLQNHRSAPAKRAEGGQGEREKSPTHPRRDPRLRGDDGGGRKWNRRLRGDDG